MQYGIFAKTFAGETPSVVLAAARAAGYDCVQYNMACSGIGSLPAVVSEEVVTAVRAASVDKGVAIAAVSATYNMIHPDVTIREKGRVSFAAIAAQAHAMGTRILTVCSGSCDAVDQWRHHPDNDSTESWRAMCEEFARLVVIADRYDVDIGVEPELANVVSDARRAKRLIEDVRSPRIRIVLDPANLFEVASSQERLRVIDEAADLLAGRISLAHAKDRSADGGFVAAGAGVIDFSRFLAALHRVGFDGALVTHGLSSFDAPAVARFLRDVASAT